MAGGMNKRGAGIPMHQRVALGRSPVEPRSAAHGVPAEAPAPGPAEADPPAHDPRMASPAGRHCWVLAPADGSGERRPGLLVEWRRTGAGDWQGRVVYVVRLRTGNQALLDEWLPQSDLAPA